MEKKKLVYVVNVDWYFSLHWRERALAAKNAGYDVYVVTNFTDETGGSTLRECGFTCISIPLKRKGVNPGSDIIYIFRLYKVLREIAPDLLHCITVKPNIYGGLVARFLHCRCILSVTGVGIVFSSNRLRYKLLRIGLKGLYRLTASYTGVRMLFENSDDQAHFVFSSIIELFRTEVIKGAGVDTHKFFYREAHDNSTPVVLFAARLLRGKGLGDLISAVAILKRRKVCCRVVVAGIVDNDCLEAIPLSQILQWHDDGVIEWLGQKDNMVEMLHLSDIVVLPTTYGEGVPRILIEGAAVGRALVATDVTGCRDIVVHESNGLLVPVNDPESLARALRQLIENNELRKMYGQRGRLLVLNEFDQTKVISETLALYGAGSGFQSS